MKRFSLLFAALSVLLFTQNASAQDPFALNLAVGLKGGLNASAASGVPEGDSFTLAGRQVADPNIYPMFGLGGGIGIALEARALDLVGLETGLHLSYDNADGYEDKNDAFSGSTLVRENQRQRTTALHVPLLLKLVVPGVVVRPVFGLGVEFVIQMDSTLEHEPDLMTNPRNVETGSYTLAMLTAGLEFHVGVVRIPLELRFGYNLGFGSTASDRVRTEGNTFNSASIIYDGAYQGHAGIFTGIIYEYDLLL